MQNHAACVNCELPFPQNLEGTSTLRFAGTWGFQLLACRLSSPTRRSTVMSRMLGAQIASERFNTAVNTESTINIYNIYIIIYKYTEARSLLFRLHSFQAHLSEFLSSFSCLAASTPCLLSLLSSPFSIAGAMP